jgi:hypothetical protein
MTADSDTEIARVKLSKGEILELFERIKEGRQASDAAPLMWFQLNNLIPGIASQPADEWGPKYATIRRARSKSDDGWQAMRDLFNRSNVKKDCGLLAFTFPTSPGYEAQEHWILLSIPSGLPALLNEPVPMPDVFARTLASIHQHDDGVWDTIVIKHTVV